MKKIVMFSTVVLGGLLLAGCGNSTSGKSAAASSSSAKVTNTDISHLQEGTTDSSDRARYKKYANSLAESYSQNSDSYHKKRVTKSSKNAMSKGSYSFETNFGVEATMLSDSTKISDQNVKGLEMSNTTYWVSAFERISPSMLEQMFGAYARTDEPLPGRTSPLFGSNTYKNGDTLIVMVVETTLKNTTNNTLLYGGLSGLKGSYGDFNYFITSDGKKTDREEISYSDETQSLELESGKTAKAKSMSILLSTGKNLKDALSKVPNNSTVKIKTGGVLATNGDKLGGAQTLTLKINY